MRVLYLDTSGGLGGIQTYSRELIAGVESRGHEVCRVRVNGDELMTDLKLSDRVPPPRYWNRYYFWRSAHRQDYRYHRAVERVIRGHAKTFRPQLIHTIHVHQIGVLHAAHALGLPSVVTCHGLEIVDDTIVPQALRRATGIHCNSNFTRGLVEGVIGPTPKTRVLSWGIRTIENAAPSKPAEFDLLTVSRLVPRKNIETVLRALVEMPQLRYAIGGSGPELENLKRQAAELGLKNVSFLGDISEERKQELLLSSRLFVMCPRIDRPGDVEGLGLVYYEAHGAGIPVIGAAAGGVPEAVGDGGLLVKNPSDPLEIRAAIAAALEPTQYEKLKANVLRRQQTHSWERYIDGFEAWYKELGAGSA